MSTLSVNVPFTGWGTLGFNYLKIKIKSQLKRQKYVSGILKINEHNILIPDVQRKKTTTKKQKKKKKCDTSRKKDISAHELSVHTNILMIVPDQLVPLAVRACATDRFCETRLNHCVSPS